MRPDRAGWLAALLLGSIAAFASAAEEDGDRLEALERRVEELEATREDAAEAWRPDWAQRIRLGGSADVGYFRRGELSPEESDGFAVWDARLFVDAELAEDVAFGDVPIVRNVGATLEWDLVRIGHLQNEVGELYVDFQHLLGSSWASAQVGRFQIPVGENYLRYSRGYRDNPFISNTVGGPWWWDEGVRVYGQGNRAGYVASISNGDTRFDTDSDTDPQGTLKLFADPWPWLHVSASGLVSGAIGRTNAAAPGALWLGETWAMAIGSRTAVPTFADGLPVPDGPNVITHTWLGAADVVLTPLDGLRIWLAGGRYHLATRGSGPYDRDLDYWIAEVVAQGGLVSPALDPLYLGLRANGITTGDGGRGYLLDAGHLDSLGFNMRSLDELSAVLGLHLGRFVRLRGEYAFRNVDLVRGVTPDVSSRVDDEHWFALDVAIAF